jgi:hypothetical protein
VLVAAGSGAAFAYWSSTGNGGGTAKSSANVPFTVSTTTATGDPLTPGGSSQTIAFTVTNPGTGTQNLSKLAATVATTVGTGASATPGTWSIGNPGATCSAADYTVVGPIFAVGSGLGQIAGGASVSGTVSISMNNLAGNQDGCKNVSVPLFFAAS